MHSLSTSLLRGVRFCLSVLPPQLAVTLYYRLFRRFDARCPSLFRHAQLRFAPGVAMDLVPHDDAHGSIAWTGVYELGLTRAILAQAKLHRTLIDVGANFGYYSLLWASQSPHHRVHAYEASPDVQVRLARNVRANHLGERILTRAVAVGAHTGIAHFQPSAQTGWGRIIETPTDASQTVPMVTLDAEFFGRLDDAVCKIDVEGHDGQVIAGARELIGSRAFAALYWEADTADWRDGTGVALRAELTVHGYAAAPLETGPCGLGVYSAIRIEK